MWKDLKLLEVMLLALKAFQASFSMMLQSGTRLLKREKSRGAKSEL